MGYWRDVSRRAVAEARKAARIETGKAVMILIVTQILIAVGLYYLSGDAEPFTRILTVAAPFLLVMPLYLWELFRAPSTLAREALERSEQMIAEKERELGAARAEVARLREEISVLKAPPLPPTREPTGIYQHGKLVAEGIRGLVDYSLDVADFERIDAQSEFNKAAAFEFQGALLQIEKFAALTGSRMGASSSASYHKVSCHVLGRV